MSRTRIKICGFTRIEDILAAINAGSDAVGFVFYPPSPRYVTPTLAAQLSRHLPPFISRVGLFVNAPKTEVQAVLQSVPLDVLQFHGEETPEYCAEFGRPYLKAARMTPQLDLTAFAQRYSRAQALLLDADVTGYGGGGQTFDWSLIPKALPLPLVLSGGLTADNVGAAILRIRPWAVDVSSGVESAKGIKDVAKISRFITSVYHADQQHAS